MESTKKIGPGKTLNAQSREIVYNVYLYLAQNIKRDGQTAGTSELYNLTALATGVSKSSVQRIIIAVRKQIDPNSFIAGAQERLDPSTLAAPSSGLVFETSGTKRPRVAVKSTLNEFDQNIIRKCVYDFHLVHKTLPTLEKVKDVLKHSINFKGSITTLRKVLLKLGFKWQKGQPNKKLLIEKNQVRFERVAYVSQLQRYRLQGRPIVYIAETNVHSKPITAAWCEEIAEGKTTKENRIVVISACTEHSFVPNSLLMFKSNSKSGDYQSCMNANNYQKWIKEMLLPNLQPESVLVINNVAYQNVQVDSTPTHNTERADMLTWLTKHKIPYPKIHTKPILYSLIKQHKSRCTEYVVDTFLEASGHNVLRLPPHHPELNILEVLFGIIKERVALKKLSDDLDLVQAFFKDEAESLTKDMFDEVSKTVKECETNYMELEKILDVYTDDFIMNSSSESGSSEHSSEDDNEYFDFWV